MPQYSMSFSFKSSEFLTAFFVFRLNSIFASFVLYSFILP